MKNIFIVSLLGSISIFIVLTLVTSNKIEYQNMSTEIVNGKQIWQKKACVECHTLFGNGGYNAPDLTKLFSEKDKEKIESFLKKRPIIRTATTKRHIDLEQNEIDSLLSYLEFVSSINTGNWPPAPLR